MKKMTEAPIIVRLPEAKQCKSRQWQEVALVYHSDIHNKGCRIFYGSRVIGDFGTEWRAQQICESMEELRQIALGQDLLILFGASSCIFPEGDCVIIGGTEINLESVSSKRQWQLYEDLETIRKMIDINRVNLSRYFRFAE